MNHDSAFQGTFPDLFTRCNYSGSQYKGMIYEFDTFRPTLLFISMSAFGDTR
jgi:hypothetical protein